MSGKREKLFTEKMSYFYNVLRSFPLHLCNYQSKAKEKRKMAKYAKEKGTENDIFFKCALNNFKPKHCFRFLDA